jgi:L-aminopeptidase/D-esterase-like protein
VKSRRIHYSPFPSQNLSGRYDGDTIFAASTGKRALQDEAAEFTEITALAADCVARAIGRGVFEATALPYADALPAWRDKYGRRT